MLILNQARLFPYLFARTIVPITAANTGSLIDVSASSSLLAGIPINAGSLRLCFARGRNHFIFEDHPTHTAHSGSIPSFHIRLSSCTTK